jgi:UDP-N-acetylmuramate dehydrogenase
VTDALREAGSILRSRCGQRVRVRFPMAQLTTLRIGGPAALYLEPESTDDLQAVAAAVAQTGVKVVVIGKGSNVLVADEGFAGVVIRLGRAYRWAARDGLTMSAGGSMPLPALAGIAQRHELSGLEFGVAIPASLGGAVTMNAGAHEGSMSQIVSTIEVFRLAEGRAQVVTAGEAGFAYRTSALGEATVVVGASVGLEHGSVEQIRARMSEARDWRRRTQPLAEPNCGSLFKNPPGSRAAGLIDDAGLKGFRVGGVQVSTKHANFIVADPGAKASDARELIRHIQRVVSDRAGISLEPEVQLIGGTIDAFS